MHLAEYDSRNSKAELHWLSGFVYASQINTALSRLLSPIFQLINTGEEDGWMETGFMRCVRELVRGMLTFQLSCVRVQVVHSHDRVISLLERRGPSSQG